VVRTLDAFRTLGSFRALGTLDALRTLGSFRALGALGPFHTLRPLDALVPFHPRDPLEAILAPLDAPVFTAVFAPVSVFTPVFAAIFAPVGVDFPLRTQLDSQAIIVLAQPHAIEPEVCGEVLHQLCDLGALLSRQSAFADAHLAHAAVEEGADLRDELLRIDGTRAVARDVELNLLTLILTAVFPPVFLAYVGGLCERSDRLRQGREESDRSNSGCDEAFARHGIPFQEVDPRRCGFAQVPRPNARGIPHRQRHGLSTDASQIGWNIRAQCLWGWLRASA
jgi:hypothetical protein